MAGKPGLRPQEAVGHSLRTVARSILGEARDALEDGRSEPEAVHDFRAAMKSWRAFLRLIEPFLPPEERRWRTEARDLARTLAGARDIQAALDAVGDLQEHAPSHRLSARSWDSIRARLEQLHGSGQTANLSASRRHDLAAALERAEAALEQWPLDPLTFPELAAHLAHHYRRARRQLPPDWRAAGAEDLHELRQRVIAHRYQMELVKPLWPRQGRGWVKEAQKLRSRLGAYQDLNVLSRFAGPHQALAPWRSRLEPLIAQRQVQHVTAARKVAARLFAERPRAFRRRLEAMWDGIAAAI